MYASKIGRSEVQIDDDNFRLYTVARDRQPEGFRDGKITDVACGLVPAPKEWRGPGMCASPFSGETIPMSEWPERIEEMERTKTRLSDIVKANGWKIKYQNGTNFCWAYGVVAALEMIRAKAGEKYVALSPTAVACLINDFRNNGGWGDKAIRFLAKNGVPEERFWKPNTYGRSARQYDTDETWANAEKYRAHEFEVLQNRNFHQQATCWLNREPTGQGYSWWRHLVCGVDLVMKPSRDAEDLGRYGVRIANSWGTGWSQGGWGIIWYRKANADGAVVPRVATG